MATFWGGVTNNTSHFGAYLEAYESDLNIADNSHLVTVKLHITRSAWGWQTSNNYGGSLEIDGTPFSFSYSPNWLYASSGDVVVGVASKRVKHNDDGKKDCYVSAAWWTSGTYSCGTASASGTLTLSQIARASGIACSSPFVGDTATITIDRKSASFTNTVTYDIGGIKGTLAEKTNETVLSLPTEDIADEIYALIPNATQIQGTVYCTTYNGNTQIGSTTSASFYLYAKEADCKPDVSGTIVDTNETTIALTGDSSTIVKYASIPKVTVNATAKKSATIKSYNINANDGQQVNLQEYTFANGIASDEVTINAKDSRGFGNPKNLTPKVIDYIPIIINAFKGDRPEDVSNEVILNASGVWFNGEFKEETSNTLVCIFYYKESGSDEWIEGSELTPTIDGNTFKFEDVSLGNLFDYEKQWQIKLKIQDLTGYAERDDLNISKGQEVVAIGDDKVWVNGETELNGNLDINGDIKQNGESIINKNIGKMIWLYRKTTQWTPANQGTIINWEAIHINDAKEALTKDDNKIKVGKDVSCVMVEAAYRSWEQGTKYIYIKQNQDNVICRSSEYERQGFVTISACIPVTENDEIAIECYSSMGMNIVGDGSSNWDYFKVTVIA